MLDDPGHPRGVGRSLVIGLGSPDRGDDAIGPTIAAAVAGVVVERQMPGVHVVEQEDPTALVELLDPHRERWDTVVIIDAVHSGAAAGTVAVIDAGAGQPSLATAGARFDPGPAGTHGFGLAGAIELSRALDRLPPRVLIVGVEAVDFTHGAPLSGPVTAAVGRAVDAVLDALAAGTPERGS